MKMRYILGLLLLPGAAMAQSTTQLIDKTTGAWLSPSAALVKSGNAAGWSFTAPNIGAATGTSLVCPTLNGGTAANDDIRIQGTTNATRATSYVTLQENGGLVGIGTATPTGLLHVVGSIGNTIIGSTGEAFTTTRGAHTAFFGTGGSGGLMGTTTNSPFSIFVNNSTTALTAATTGIITFPIGVTVGAVSFSGITADPNADRISFWDDSAGSVQWLSLSGLTITGTTLAVDAATESAAGKGEISTTAEAQAMTNDTTFITPLKVAAAINYATATSLTADDQVITVGTERTILLTSNSSTATDRTFEISAPASDGLDLALMWDEVAAGDKAEFLTTNTIMPSSSGVYIFQNPGDALYFKSNGGVWVFVSASPGTDIYSTSEVAIGRWVDGTTLYRKTIDVGAYPNTTTTTDAHGISGGSFSGGSFKSIVGYGTNGTSTQQFPNAAVTLVADGTNISITATANFSSYSGYVTVLYTK